MQANPKLGTTKDDDDRLPIHWAVSYNHFDIVELLVSQKNFDPDVEVSYLCILYKQMLTVTGRMGQGGHHL